MLLLFVEILSLTSVDEDFYSFYWGFVILSLLLNHLTSDLSLES